MSETGESHGGDGPRSSVFQYRDYARFLSDFVAERKRCSPSFSYKVLCRAAGLRSQSLVGMIATGQRLPSRDVLRKLNGAMRLTPAERDYLETLVEYQKSRDDAAQRTLARKLDALGHKYEARPISLDHFRLISDWYHLVILELLNLKDFVEDPAWIAARLGAVGVHHERRIHGRHGEGAAGEDLRVAQPG